MKIKLGKLRQLLEIVELETIAQRIAELDIQLDEEWKLHGDSEKFNALMIEQEKLIALLPAGYQIPMN